MRDSDLWELRTLNYLRDDDVPIPQKVAYDVEYLYKRSFSFDLKILWLTFVKVLRREGVSH